MTLDIESTLDEIKGVLQSGLNAKLTAITAEKGDSLSLPSVDSAAYVFQDLNQAPVNYNPFLYYGLTGIEGEGMYSNTPQKLSIVAAIVIVDNGQDGEIARKLFRYQRAIKEVVEEGFDSLTVGGKMSVQNMVPIEVTLIGSSTSHKAIGVSIQVDLA